MRDLFALFGRLFFGGDRRSSGSAPDPDPAWVINPSDGQIVFVSTPDFPAHPATFVASPVSGGIFFEDL